MGFSPVVPANSEHVVGQLRRSRAIIAAHDVDFYASCTLSGRTVRSVRQMFEANAALLRAARN